MPLPAQQLWFHFLPATKQGSPDLKARYTEAVPHVPGSGMVKPVKDLGCVEMLIELKLTAPGHTRFGLLAAYAFTGNQREHNDESEDDEDEVGASASNPPKG